MDWSVYHEPLRRYPDFRTDHALLPRFQYADAADGPLVAYRTRYGFEAIAGAGDTRSRIAAVTHWVHQTLTHHGAHRTVSPATPEHIIDTCMTTGCALFCAHKAIVLTEALLALGIRARRLTCLPYAFDGDCHVVTMAWLPEFGRWALFDPTFDTWFTDTDDVPLSPVDVRACYVSGSAPAFRPITLPNLSGLFLNGVECAAYDEWYAAYMAKNCFRFRCPLRSVYGQAFQEDAHVCLDPIDFTDRNAYDAIDGTLYRTDSQSAFLKE